MTRRHTGRQAGRQRDPIWTEESRWPLPFQFQKNQYSMESISSLWKWKCVFSVLLLLLLLCLNSAATDPAIKDVRIGIPVTLQLNLAPFIEASPGVKPGSLIACERVHIPGLPRFTNINKYAHSYRVRVESSEVLSGRFAEKIEVCIHQNASLGLGQCPKDEWKLLQKGLWSVTMSPYETRFVDIRIIDSFSISVTISVDEEFRLWRLVFLASGLVMLLLAPIVSEWVPFYYSSAMALGIILVILMLLFQGMKLLPTGRKSAIYLAFYGSVVGLGSLFVQYLSGLVNSILQKLGLGEEMYNPVAVFVTVGIVLTGAWFGFWGVRKFVLSEDGGVDFGTAQFVKWAIRILAVVTILQSSHDPFFALLAVVAGIISTSSLRAIKYGCLISGPTDLSLTTNQNVWRHKVTNGHLNQARVQFLTNIPNVDAERCYFQANRLQRNPKSTYSSPSSPKQGLFLTSPRNSPSSNASIDEQDYYSTFHKTAGRKQFSKEGWESFTRESTRKAMCELVSKPEFSDWVVEHADRINVAPDEERESSDDETEVTDDTEPDESIEGVRWFRW